MKLLRYNKLQLIVLTGFLISIVCIMALPGAISIAFSLAFILLSIGIGYKASKRGNKKASTAILLMPVIMSVAQNVYLGLGVYRLNTAYLQVLLSLHFLLFTGLVLLNIDTLNRKAQWAIISIAVIVLQTILLLMVYPANFTSVMSSVRNILSCMLLYCFGVVMNRRVDTKEYYKWIFRISWLVVVFGLIEWSVGLSVWESLNITRLWELKRIPTNLWGIPPNWYSSEMIGGNQIRRMVSTFADPVNLGAFLFAAFMIAWYRKKKILTIALFLCCVLTVSKGAFLGFLVFAVVYVWQKKNLRLLLPVMASTALVAGLLFIRYSLVSSTGSIIAHARGFFSAFAVLKSHPLGLGVGNVGVLAGLFNEGLLSLSVSETGIGMVIAQLGIVGLAVYVFFFAKLSTIPQKWIAFANRNVQREKVLYYTLLFSFIANALFNEVALSPNSCGPYFIELAFLNCEMEITNQGIANNDMMSVR